MVITTHVNAAYNVKETMKCRNTVVFPAVEIKKVVISSLGPGLSDKSLASTSAVNPLGCHNSSKYTALYPLAQCPSKINWAPVKWTKMSCCNVLLILNVVMLRLDTNHLQTSFLNFSQLMPYHHIVVDPVRIGSGKRYKCTLAEHSAK